jgi:hypothetical protein
VPGSETGGARAGETAPNRRRLLAYRAEALSLNTEAGDPKINSGDQLFMAILFGTCP